jgi:hypothetical protein
MKIDSENLALLCDELRKVILRDDTGKPLVAPYLFDDNGTYTGKWNLNKIENASLSALSSLAGCPVEEMEKGKWREINLDDARKALKR